MANNLQRITVPTSFVLLTLLAVLSSACAIVSYSPIEPARQTLVEPHHDKKEFLSFSYIPESPRNLNTEPRTLPREIQGAKELLEHELGSSK